MTLIKLAARLQALALEHGDQQVSAMEFLQGEGWVQLKHSNFQHETVEL